MQKDKLWTHELDDLWQQWQNAIEREGLELVMSNAKRVEYRWMLEEYRVSIFAQNLKTVKPVSEKRLKKLWQESET